MGRKVIPIKERFDAKYKIDETTGCWVWTAGVNNSGYPLLKQPDKAGMITAHRASYEIHKGPIPEGMCVGHTCTTRNCVNPDHLHAKERTEILDYKRKQGVFRIPSSRVDTCEYCGIERPHHVLPRLHNSRNCGTSTSYCEHYSKKFDK